MFKTVQKNNQKFLSDVYHKRDTPPNIPANIQYPLLPSSMWSQDITTATDFIYPDRKVQQQKDWEEFEKWKKSKEVNIQQKKDGIHIVLGCVHCPHENKVLVEKLISFIKENKDKIIGFHLIGDFMDMRINKPT